MRIAIVGAGLCGLTCARMLSDAGMSPVVFDKGRGLGGRLATRRGEAGLQFDHGAQYMTAESEGFASFLKIAETAGAVARWHDGRDLRCYVGLPGMSGLARHLAHGLEVRRATEVQDIARVGGIWRLTTETSVEEFDLVVLTTPAPQTTALLGPGEPLVAQLSEVKFDPCLTLMLALPSSFAPPFATRSEPGADIPWIALDSAKPGRSDAQCWVAQAGPDFSRRHLEADKAEIAALMTPLVCETLGADPNVAIHIAAHRWRYAQAVRPLGQPFAATVDGTLYVGGDWCLGARAEDAWVSGEAIAAAILDHA